MAIMKMMQSYGKRFFDANVAKRKALPYFMDFFQLLLFFPLCDSHIVV
jgi:hypothetical protein